MIHQRKWNVRNINKQIIYAGAFIARLIQETINITRYSLLIKINLSLHITSSQIYIVINTCLEQPSLFFVIKSFSYESLF